MVKQIPYKKLSKKKQREQNAARRGCWYGVNPVTRSIESAKAYHRQKARNWKDDSTTVPFVHYSAGRGNSRCGCKIVQMHKAGI